MDGYGDTWTVLILQALGILQCASEGSQLLSYWHGQLAMLLRDGKVQSDRRKIGCKQPTSNLVLKTYPLHEDKICAATRLYGEVPKLGIPSGRSLNQGFHYFGARIGPPIFGNCKKSSFPLLSACAAGLDIEIISDSVSFQAIPMQQSFCSKPLGMCGHEAGDAL